MKKVWIVLIVSIFIISMLPGIVEENETAENTFIAKKFIERLPAGIFHKEIATPEMLEGWMKPYFTEEGKLSLIRNASALNTNHTMELM